MLLSHHEQQKVEHCFQYLILENEQSYVVLQNAFCCCRSVEPRSLDYRASPTSYCGVSYLFDLHQLLYILLICREPSKYREEIAYLLKGRVELEYTVVWSSAVATSILSKTEPQRHKIMGHLQHHIVLRCTYPTCEKLLCILVICWDILIWYEKRKAHA